MITPDHAILYDQIISDNFPEYARMSPGDRKIFLDYLDRNYLCYERFNTQDRMGDGGVSAVITIIVLIVGAVVTATGTIYSIVSSEKSKKALSRAQEDISALRSETSGYSSEAAGIEAGTEAAKQKKRNSFMATAGIVTAGLAALFFLK